MDGTRENVQWACLYEMELGKRGVRKNFFARAGGRKPLQPGTVDQKRMAGNEAFISIRCERSGVTVCRAVFESTVLD